MNASLEMNHTYPLFNYVVFRRKKNVCKLKKKYLTAGGTIKTDQHLYPCRLIKVLVVCTQEFMFFDNHNRKSDVITFPVMIVKTHNFLVQSDRTTQINMLI